MTRGRLSDAPFHSCILPTRDRRRLVPLALDGFFNQTPVDAELLILDDGADCIADLIPADPRMRYFREERRLSVGAKRNRLCELARGDVIVHWDDDDWSRRWRLRYQVRALTHQRRRRLRPDRVLFHEPDKDRAWEYRYPRRAGPWVLRRDARYTKAFWRRNPFPDIQLGEDTRFVWSNAGTAAAPSTVPRFYRGPHPRRQHQPEADSGSPLAFVPASRRRRPGARGAARFLVRLAASGAAA